MKINNATKNITAADVITIILLFFFFILLT